ncbi:hypothetical protein ARSEF4850_000866 [Beauveria asiatica]
MIEPMSHEQESLCQSSPSHIDEADKRASKKPVKWLRDKVSLAHSRARVLCKTMSHRKTRRHLPLQGVYDERAQICQMWSPRMRAMWRAVCDDAAGAPGSAESEASQVKFRAFGTKRLEVWRQTVPRIQFLRHVRDMKMIQAMRQGQLSLMHAGMNSMAVLSGTDDGDMHGNSSLGWYETENGATGAQMFNNMQTGMADATRADGWMEMFQLELLWKEVE